MIKKEHKEVLNRSFGFEEKDVLTHSGLQIKTHRYYSCFPTNLLNQYLKHFFF